MPAAQCQHQPTYKADDCQCDSGIKPELDREKKKQFRLFIHGTGERNSKYFCVRSAYLFLLFFLDWTAELPSFTDSLVPFPVSLSTSNRPPTRSARSRIPSRPKCPAGANSVGLFGTVNPIPLSAISSLISLSNVMDRRACSALAWCRTLFKASCAIRYSASSTSLDRRRSSPSSWKSTSRLPVWLNS